MTTTTSIEAKAEGLAARRRRVLDEYDAVLAETWRMVHDLKDQGVPVVRIADIFGVDRQQVYKWLKKDLDR